MRKISKDSVSSPTEPSIRQALPLASVFSRCHCSQHCHEGQSHLRTLGASSLPEVLLRLGWCPRTCLSLFPRGLSCHFTQTGDSLCLRRAFGWPRSLQASVNCGQASMTGLSLTLRKARDIRAEESGAEKGDLLLWVHPKNWC